MKKSLDLNTPVRSYRLLSLFVVVAFLCLQSGGQTLERLATAYANKPTPANRAAILRFAAAHTRDQQGALAYFSMARTEMEAGAYGAALGHVKSAGARLPELADYLAFVKGATEYRAKDFGAAGATLAELLRLYANSPLRTDAAILGAKAFMESGDADAAIRLLRSPGTRERQPEFDFLLGKAYSIRKDFAQSAAYLQRVALRFPQRPEAPDAEILLRQAESALGTAYPPPTAKDLLARAEVLRASRRYDEAKAALQALIPQLLGEDRERAELHIAVMEYDRQRSSIARQMLESLSPQAEEVDAERLYYLVQCARRLDLPDAMRRYADTLRTRYPYSEWTMNAHRWAGNFFLLQNDRDAYVPLFRACADSRPQDPESAYCHWKVVWASYLGRRPGTDRLIEDHLTRYPHSDKYAAGLYFLGRWWERAGNRSAARAAFEELLTVEPLSYYAEVATQSLQGRPWTNATPDAAVSARLAAYRGKSLREDFTEVAATPETARRLKRASLLSRVDMTDWVDLELRSYNADLQQRQLLAMELASVYRKAGDHFRALRTMKSMAPGYFRLKVEQAPKRFWELLFPMPYGPSLTKHSTARGLDPYLVAGLIRQESEFRPDAVSRAKARGLMQVLPSTGRSLTRRLRLGTYRVARLDQPDYNINLGTYYLATISSAFDGRWEYVLASYNAGKSRADSWKTWAQYEEPLEFIETIPFSETREYVLSVLRNAMVYRLVYPNLGNVRVARSKSPTKRNN